MLLLQRTQVGYSTIALALASGAAAALSLTSRLSTVLVGVMVAIALLPPLVTCGIFFAVNVVSVNLAANLVFIFQGIHSGKWYEKKTRKNSDFLVSFILDYFVVNLIYCNLFSSNNYIVLTLHYYPTL